MSELPVYPRWRGELIVHINNRGEFNGLSPLARGTHYGPGKKRAGGRFIPDGAGNSSWLAISFGVSPVYPRWRGELAGGDAQGMRDSRFIPAGAGNSRPLRNSRPDPNGLSPLARGTLNIINYNRQGARFIPAGAGNSACSASPLASAAVYPRWRGELCVSVSPRVCESGLSPLARGTL